MITIVPETDENPMSYWAATLLERFEIEGLEAADAHRRRRMFARTVLVRASDREGARLKAVDQGLKGETCGFDWVNERTGERGRWTFEGVADLSPIYGEWSGGGFGLDGADGGRVPIKDVRPLVRKKREREGTLAS